MLSKSKEEYLNNNGWSSHLFFNKSKELIYKLEKDNYVLDFGRTVIYILKDNKRLKVYPHYNGRSKEYITFVDDHNELMTFHFKDDAKLIYQFIDNYFKNF